MFCKLDPRTDDCFQDRLAEFTLWKRVASTGRVATCDPKNQLPGGCHIWRASLEREPVAVQDRGADLDLELAEEAARLLGYVKLKKPLAGAKGVQDLAMVLKQLDIEPFSPASVARYKAEAPDETELPDVPEFFKRHRKLARILLWLFPVWGILSMMGTVGWLISWKLGLASLVSFLLLLKKGCEFDDRLAGLFPRWERVPFRDYQEEVPYHVLRKALAIKKQLPNAEFYIEQRGKDPFLSVKCNEEEYYIEVWREHRFE